MITRYKMQVDDILHSESLNCYPAENQAAKIFVEWLKKHPEYSPDDVDMRIDSYEREEDHYGNGGGLDQYVRIFKRREETQAEYDARIAKGEAESLDKFKEKLRFLITDLIHDFSIYPNMVSDAITAHTNDIENAVMDVVKEKIYQQKD